MDEDSNDSEEELRILMTRIQDDIYDPLGSLTTLNGTVSSLEKSNDSTTHQEEKMKDRFKTKTVDSERSSNGNENQKSESKINRIIIDEKLLAGLTPEPRKPSPYNSNAYAVYTSIPRNSSTEARHSKQKGSASGALVNEIKKDSSVSMPLTHDSTRLRTYNSLTADGEPLVNVTPKTAKKGCRADEFIDDTSEEISDVNVVAEANLDGSENKIRDKNTESNTSVSNSGNEEKSTIPNPEKLRPASSPQENVDEMDNKIQERTPSLSLAKENSKHNGIDKLGDGLHESSTVLNLDRSDTFSLNSTGRRTTNAIEEGTENDLGIESSVKHGDITNKRSPIFPDETNRILPENDGGSVSSRKGSPTQSNSPANERNSQENVRSEKNVGAAPFVNNISPNHDTSVSSSLNHVASNCSMNIGSNIWSPKKNPSAIYSPTNIDSPNLSAVNGKHSSLPQNDTLNKSFVSICKDEGDSIRNESVVENDEINDKNSVESNRDENNSTRNSNKKDDESELSSTRKSDDFNEYLGNKSDLELNLGDNDSLTNYSDSDPESESDAPKKPKWHPPWQLNQVN